MRIPFSGYNDHDLHADNLYRICEPGLGGRVFWLRSIVINNPTGGADRQIKLYDEAEADSPTTPTDTKQRAAITAKSEATTVVDFPAPGIKFVDDLGAVGHADILAYNLTVIGYLE